MPNVAIYNISGAKVGEMELSENIFGQELNVPAMHAYVKAYLANQRQGTQSVKTRAEVSGGGKKPWRQKGTFTPSGFNQIPPVDARRRCIRSQAPRLSHEPQQEAQEGCT